MSTIPITPLAITLDEAIEWTARWRDSGHRAKAKARAFTFYPDEINAVMNQPGMVKVRFYLGLAIDKTTGAYLEKMVCVGVNKDGKDMVPRDKNSLSDESGRGEGEIYDFSHPCPDACDDSSPLN